MGRENVLLVGRRHGKVIEVLQTVQMDSLVEHTACERDTIALLLAE